MSGPRSMAHCSLSNHLALLQLWPPRTSPVPHTFPPSQTCRSIRVEVTTDVSFAGGLVAITSPRLSFLRSNNQHPSDFCAKIDIAPVCSTNHGLTTFQICKLFGGRSRPRKWRGEAVNGVDPKPLGFWGQIQRETVPKAICAIGPQHVTLGSMNVFLLQGVLLL
jgi:hypothetical protein